ncbi:MAG TPA: TetR/AcrR family transcriptional regulator [Candidatus Acidoferrales bacterium]|nr:TetR/AcrR family transcriptional regulator [Candidatus Acidoferrales bacterium]
MSASSTPSNRAHPRWQRRKEARPAEILDAALQEFATRGFAATRLEDIARRAGCTKGTIFLYFENKEDLFKAIVRENLLPAIYEAEARAANHEGTPGELLRELVRARWDMMVNSRLSAVPKLVFSEAGNFPDLVRYFYDEIVARSHALFAKVLRAGIEQGEFRDDLDVMYVTRALMSPMLVAALWKHSVEGHSSLAIDGEKYYETSLALLLAGLAAPAAGGNR